MRIDRILALADFVENTPHQFDMEIWKDANDCGTVACIGGHCELLKDYVKTSKYSWEGVADYLEISPICGQKLCYPFEHYDPWGATKVQAANVIRWLALTGQVHWDRLNQPTPVEDLKKLLDQYSNGMAECREEPVEV